MPASFAMRADKAYIEWFVFIFMLGKKIYFALALILIVFLLMALVSPYKAITGKAITADFEDKLFDTGEIVTGNLRIEVTEDNLPADSVVEIRLGEQVVEKPLLSLLNDKQKLNIQNVIYYPSVKANLKLVVTRELELGTSLIDYITGGFTGFAASGGMDGPGFFAGGDSGSGPGEEGEGEEGGGSQSSGTGTRNYDFDNFVVSSGESSVSFEGLRIASADISEARLFDGTLISRDFIKVDIKNGRTIEITSDYKENVMGFKKGIVLDVQLVSFLLEASDSDMRVLIKDKRGDIIQSKVIYLPYKGRYSIGKAPVYSSESEEEFIIDFIGSSGRGCGEAVCRIDDCVSPNADSGRIMLGELEGSLVTRVSCSNSCLTEERIVACEKEEKNLKIDSSSDGEARVIEITDEETGNVVAILKISGEKLDIRFTQVS